MPDVIEGLTLGDEVFAPGAESDDPFVASFLSKQAGTPEEPPAEGPGSAQAAGTPAPAEGTPTEGSVETETPNEWQVRYDEAQKVIGRQGTELGELRAKIEAIEASQQAPAYEPVTFIAPEQAEALVEQNGGEGALLLAIEDGVDPDSQAFRVLFDAAADAAESQSDAVALLRLEMQYRAQIEQETSKPEAPASDPALVHARTTYLESQVANIAAEARASNPDFDALTPHFAAAAEVAGLKGPLESGDPAQIKTAVQTLVLVARGIAAQAGEATSQASGEAAAAAAAARAAAQVATGSLRPAAVGAPEAGTQEADDEAVAAFKKAFRETATPSVADGLTLG